MRVFLLLASKTLVRGILLLAPNTLMRVLFLAGAEMVFQGSNLTTLGTCIDTSKPNLKKVGPWKENHHYNRLTTLESVGLVAGGGV